MDKQKKTTFYVKIPVNEYKAGILLKFVKKH